MQQLIIPNPNIWCEPGWCLQYVRQTFGLPARYGTATEAWEKSASKHRDRNFPKGVWVPVWYGLDKEPAGHVVLMAPDGSVYSTSDYSNTPRHHPNLAHLEWYYAYYGMTLTYRGWTEDVAGYPVLAADDITISTQGITTEAATDTQEDFMGGQIDAVQAESMVQETVNRVVAALNGKIVINPQQAEDIVQASVERVVGLLKEGAINRQQADDIARAAAQYNQEQDANLYKNREVK